MSAVNIIYPVHPGPVTKFASKNPPIPRLFFAEIWAKLFQCAMVWTQEKKTIDHAVRMWNVMFLSKGMMPFKGVCLAMEISVRHTGKRIKAISKCKTKAAARAIGYVRPNVLLAVDKLSLSWWFMKPKENTMTCSAMKTKTKLRSLARASGPEMLRLTIDDNPRSPSTYRIVPLNSAPFVSRRSSLRSSTSSLTVAILISPMLSTTPYCSYPSLCCSSCICCDVKSTSSVCETFPVGRFPGIIMIVSSY